MSWGSLRGCGESGSEVDSLAGASVGLWVGVMGFRAMVEIGVSVVFLRASRSASEDSGMIRMQPLGGAHFSGSGTNGKKPGDGKAGRLIKARTSPEVELMEKAINDRGNPEGDQQARTSPEVELMEKPISVNFTRSATAARTSPEVELMENYSFHPSVIVVVWARTSPEVELMENELRPRLFY